MKTVTVGFIGCGVVGGAALKILIENAPELAQRAGASIEVGGVAVRDLDKPRAVTLPEETWTTDAWALVKDDRIDVVVEAVGGIEPARALILEAVATGKHVVTANKELLSTAGKEIMDAAETAGVDLLFEAAVAGGIPIIRPLKESLAGDRIRRVLGIVNGTTNFILTQMAESGSSFDEALGTAKDLGYAESDPSADVEGFDAAAKLAILASVAFNARVVAEDVHREGIASVTPEDIKAAHDLGYSVKLLAVAELNDGQVSVSVHPSMVPRDHPLASVRDVFNAVFIEGEHAGELMFLGRGAGGGPSASAVTGDVIEIARNLVTGGRSVGCTCYHDRAHIRPFDETRVRYYVVLEVLDQPGVLASVAGVFARHGVSIASVRQEGRGTDATLALISHVETEGRHRAVFSELKQLEVVRSIVSRLRVEGTGEE